MIKKAWSCLCSALITIFPLALGLPNTAAKAEPEVQLPPTLKVGETRSQAIARSQGDAIAKIHSYQLGKKFAATVYVRNLPVVTFVTAVPNTKSSVKLPSAIEARPNEFVPKDSVERATAFAALINQFARDGFDASNINPVWQSQQYLVKFGTQVAMKLDDSLIIPNTTNDKARDTLQTANLLRWLLGNARPATTVSGLPAPATPKLPVAVISRVISGMASWYGPGFHGNYSASGELFNQNSLTAAHPNLPFGTPVRVTNMDNGKSVIVRINDRGPYAYDRVIDLSRGAASIIGLVYSGVAPVKLEVLRK